MSWKYVTEICTTQFSLIGLKATDSFLSPPNKAVRPTLSLLPVCKIKDGSELTCEEHTEALTWHLQVELAGNCSAESLHLAASLRRKSSAIVADKLVNCFLV